MRSVISLAHRPIFVIFMGMLCSAALVFSEDIILRQVQDIQKTATALQQAGDLAGARTEYEEIIRMYPGTPEALDSQVRIVGLHLQASESTQAKAALQVLWDNHAAQADFVRRVHEVAWEFVKAADYVTAIKAYADLQTQYPDHERAVWFQRSVVQTYLEQGDMDNVRAAVEQLKTAYTSHPDYVNQMALTAERLRWKKQHVMAAEIYEHLLATHPGHSQAAPVKRMQVQTSLEMEQLETARQQLDVMLNEYSTMPDYVRHAHELNWEFILRKDYDTALKICNTLLKQHPDHERAAWFQRSVVQTYLEQGDVEKVRTAVEQLKSMTGAKDHINQMEITADRLMNKGHYDIAQGVCDSLVQNYSNHERRIWFAQKRVRADLGAGMDTSAEEQVALIHQDYAQHKDYHDALSWAAYEFRQYGRYDKAIAMYSGLFEATSDKKVQLRCDEGIARAYVRLGDDEKVLQQAERIYSHYADNPDGIDYYIFELGEEYFKMATEAEQANIRDPNHHIFQMAARIWSGHLERYPQSRPEYPYFTAMAYYHAKCWPEAIASFQSVVNRWPRFDRAWYAQYMIARCYEQLLQEGHTTAENVSAAYRDLIVKYPDCSAATLAERKLKSL